MDSNSRSDARIRSVSELRFERRFTTELPGDADLTNVPRPVQGAAYSRVRPTPVAAPKLLAVSEEVAELLGMDRSVWDSGAERAAMAQLFSGNHLPANTDPYAACYGGHQFGNWAGQLGDGRAIALGEVRDCHGESQTLQLKGAGPTPYSRGADGRAVLRSSIREFLCSEALHHLAIPTTRALCLVETGDQVVRDVLYDGHPGPEPGAVVCRVAPSFLRFGNFQLPASRDDLELLEGLVRFTVRHHFRHIDPGAPISEQVSAMFDEVCASSVELVVHWMRVGFVHGVLNTDNLSILGLTIDYGPYGWLEGFEPGWTPNTTDAGTRRYRYGAQPQIVQWNLWQLANALVPLMDDPSPLQAALDRYPDQYQSRFQTMVAARLGWGGFRDEDSGSVEALFAALQAAEIDQVLFFRDLAKVATGSSDDMDGLGDRELLAPIEDAWYRAEDLSGPAGTQMAAWLRTWGVRARDSGLTDTERRVRMDGLNPRFVLRNYLAQEAIDAAEAGDPAAVIELLDVLRQPYDEQPGRERFSYRRPEWARNRVGCSMLSCSS